MQASLDAKDLLVALKVFDGKGAFVAVAAKRLKSMKRDAFEEWLVRVLRKDTVPRLVKAIQGSLPVVEPR